MSPSVVLSLKYKKTPHTPLTELRFTTEGADAKIVKTELLLDDAVTETKASNHIFELVYRYPEKHIASANLRIGETSYFDSDGDGVIDATDEQCVKAIDLLTAAFPNLPKSHEPMTPQSLFTISPDYSGASALQQSYRSPCGSIAAEVHELRSHSMLWASIPPNSPPNEVHRHIGGIVYCVFYQGCGRFHRVTPHGFETLTINVTEANSFQMIAIADHLWYQPINTGPNHLQYFMIHAPNFENCEMLSLRKSDCPAEWPFEW